MKSTKMLALLVGTLVIHSAAQAATITCDDLANLQKYGKDRFAALRTGNRDEFGYESSSWNLSGAICDLSETDQNWPEFKCKWMGFTSESHAIAFFDQLSIEIKTCLPADHKVRARNGTTSEGSTTFSHTYTFGYLQPNIRLSRMHRPKGTFTRDTVTFYYKMALHESQ